MMKQKTLLYAVMIALFLSVAPLSASLAQPAHDQVRVPAGSGWVDSGFQLAAGQPVNLSAYGMAVTARINIWGTVSLSGPDGQTEICPNFDGAPACAMENAPFGALVGKIGEDGTPFLVGSNLSFTPGTSGELYLSVNDYLIYYSDNYGNYMVFIDQ